MSLINDALKRATQARAPKPDGSNPDDPMRAAEPHSSVGLPTYFMPVILFVVTGACFFIVKGWDARRQAGTYPQPVTIQARELPTAPPKPDPIISAQATAAAEPPAPVPENRQFAVEETSAPPIEEVFRLQGIFFRPKRPSAVVNSQTIYIGDTVGSGKVKAITRDNVTLIVNGQDKVLTLR